MCSWHCTIHHTAVWQLSYFVECSDQVANQDIFNKDTVLQVVGRTAAVRNFIRVVPDWKGATKNAFYISYMTATGYDQYLPTEYQKKVAVHTWSGTALSYQIIKPVYKTVLSAGAPPSPPLHLLLRLMMLTILLAKSLLLQLRVAFDAV
jgi:hypothetical protein